jgi:hypothetical protein
MHGDFSRDSFDPKLNFSRVLMQQGRLIVDADFNEQSAILLNYIRALAVDMIGWHGGAGNSLKATECEDGGIKIEGGRYYINGFMAEWPEMILPKFDDVQNYDRKPKSDTKDAVLVFADLYEQMVSAEERSEISDPGLGGVSTCARQEVVPAVQTLWIEEKVISQDGEPLYDLKDQVEFHELIGKPLRTPDEIPNLVAFTNRESSIEDDCFLDYSSGYTGLENQLYRVEVHSAGNGKTFWNTDIGNNLQDAFTLKWSRDNGSIAYQGVTTGAGVTLTSKWRDDSRGIRCGDYVELISSDHESLLLSEVTSISEEDDKTMLLFGKKKVSIDIDQVVVVRRWDHRHRTEFPIADNGGFFVKKSKVEGCSIEIPLEEGVFVQIQIPNECKLKKGDFWLIPARSSTSDILWEKDDGKHGRESYKPKNASNVNHYCAPIALITKDGSGLGIKDLRYNFRK